MVSAAKKHFHTYVRVKHKKRQDLYMCSDPECSHYKNRMYLLGKLAICYYCGVTFVLGAEQLKLKIPHCQSCSGRSQKTKAVAISLLDQILGKKDIFKN